MEAAYEAAFQEMLRDPGNFDKTFRFAQLAVQVGDLEGAISAYSRLLITIPEYWQIRYELGVLYFRLKSFALSKSYFDTAMKNKDVPPETRRRVARFMAEIDKQLSQNRIAGSLSVGLRYQTNVNAGSNVPDVDPALRDAFAEKDDFDVFGNLDFNHLYDFGTVGGTAWKSRAQVYGAKQMSEEEFDLVYIDTDSGPQFRLDDGSIEGVLLQPFALVDYVRLGESTLYSSYGAGVRLEKIFGAKLISGLSYDFRDRSFRDNALRPNSSNLDGVIQKVETDLLYAVTPHIGTNLRLRASSQNASAPFESNREFAAQAGLTVAYDPPIGPTQGSWLSGITVEYARAIYDEPNPNTDPDNSRINQRWSFRFVSSVPLSPELSAVVSAGYTDNGSNIATFEYTNTDVFVALSYRF